jgi:hypothetical protein
MARTTVPSRSMYAVASGVNRNERVYESIEASGAGTEPQTDAQFEAVAHLVAAASRATGIPINRSTVVVHADINSVSRRSDPLVLVDSKSEDKHGAVTPLGRLDRLPSHPYIVRTEQARSLPNDRNAVPRVRPDARGQEGAA